MQTRHINPSAVSVKWFTPFAVYAVRAAFGGCAFGAFGWCVVGADNRAGLA